MNEFTPKAPLPLAIAILLPLGARTLALPALDPTIAYLLLSVGFLGLLIETTHPGTVAPGVIGGACLLGGALALVALESAWWAVGLLLAAEVVTVASAHWVRRSWLTVVGVAGFALGSLLLVRAATIAPLVVLASVAVVAVASFALAAAARRVHTWPVRTGPEALVGRVARAREPLAPVGFVTLGGELWRARSVAGEIARGDPVRILGLEGLTLLVAPDAPGPLEDLRSNDQRQAAGARHDGIGD